MNHFKALKDYLFLLILLQMVGMMKLVQKTIKNIFFQEKRLKITTDWLMEEIFKINQLSTRYGDNYTTGCLLDYVYFKDHYRLFAVDLSKQKTLDADPRAIQQIVFQAVVGGDANAKIRLYTILEQ